MADEFGRQPQARTLLEKSILFYRTESGELVALQNRCLHRAYPLSEGKLEGDNLVCGYHGALWSGWQDRTRSLPVGPAITGGRFRWITARRMTNSGKPCRRLWRSALSKMSPPAEICRSCWTARRRHSTTCNLPAIYSAPAVAA
ncbi:hypothetical protein CHN51_08230 [Sphingorhabdus sp. YGSMI21]|nr:hypothetical protein CHN51_08230 [Sphingorhabdus sp. YGSMI21]